MFDDLPGMIAANNRALKALNQCLARLNQFTIGATSSTFAMLQVRIGQTSAEINLLHLVNAHLGAATTTFKPLSGEALAALQGAFDRIDRAIVNNAIVNAGIDTINDVFATASKIVSITNTTAG